MLFPRQAWAAENGWSASTASARQGGADDERRLSRIRAVVEHPFLVVKRLWGHAKVRYRGIAKNLAQMNTLFGLANLYRVRYRLLSP